MALVSARVSPGDVEKISTPFRARFRGVPLAGSGVAAPVSRLVGHTVVGHRRRNGRVGMRASTGMGALVVAGVIGLTAAGCSNSPSSEPPKPTVSSSAPAPAPVPAVLTLSPAKDAKDVAPGEPVSV